MSFFKLPDRTKVNRFIPKNAFDEYTNTRQKKLFTDLVQRLTWTNKLSEETVNLDSKEITEIQIFKVELKERVSIPKILEIINKAIPYHIVFWVEFEQEAYISTSSKHQHPTNEDNSVVDWTFTTDWFPISSSVIRFNLKGSLDQVFKDLCVQITGKPDLEKESLEAILNNEKDISRLEREIAKLKSAISRSKQFNKKVELNLRLQELEKELKKLN